MLVYRAKNVLEVENRRPEEDEIAWIHLESPSPEDVEQLLGQDFHCHPLVVEDAIQFKQRPKLDHYRLTERAQVFISFYSISRDLRMKEFCIVMGKNYVITVAHEPVEILTEVSARVRNNPEFMETPVGLIYQILDHCVDGYFAMIDELEDKVDRFERRVFNHPEARIAAEVFRLKRKLQKVRRCVSDGRNVIGILSHESFPYTDEHESVYFVDVFDHAARIVDSLDSVRDNLTGLLDLQTAQRANRMNEVMKTLTIISTIFLPLTFITGLYGMNFHDIPELSWPFGYVYAWCLMLLVTGVLLYIFKRRKWW